MDARNQPPKYISGGRYQEYHPGTVELSSKNNSWQDLLLTRYSHPHFSPGCPRPATSDHILAFSDNGAVKGEYSLNHSKWRPYTWRSNEWFIGQAYENHRDSRWNSLCSQEVELSVCYLHLSPHILDKFALEVADKSPGVIEIPHKMGIEDPLMLQLGKALLEEAKSKTPFGRVFVETVASLFAVHLLKNYCSTRFTVTEFQGQNNGGIKQAIDYIHGNLGQNLSLSVLAKLANMSNYHFARTFKKAIGVAPHKYIIEARVEKAKRLLRETRLPINSIALELGYNTSHFVQLFKNNTGVTPRTFRNA